MPSRFSNTPKIQGIVLIIFAVFMMSIQDALFKDLSDKLSLWQAFTLRGICALPLFLVIFRLQGQPAAIWRTALQPWALVRGSLFAISFIALYAAMPFLSLSTVAAGYYTAPIFVAILSVVFLNERIGLRGFFAVIIGFTGVLIILRPGSNAFSLWALLPVLGGLSYAMANIITRSKCLSFPVPALALAVNLTLLFTGAIISLALVAFSPAATLTAAFPFLLDNWSAVAVPTGIKIIALSVFIIGIASCVAKAYQIAAPAMVATFEYCYLIFVALWDYWFFETAPTWGALMGIVLIVAAGWLISQKDTTQSTQSA